MPMLSLLSYFRNLFGPEQRLAVICQHQAKTSRIITLSAFGTSVQIRHNPLWIDFCEKCLSDMTIQCAWCDQPIFIGDKVTMYQVSHVIGDPRIPAHAVVFTREPLVYIGCARTECMSSSESPESITARLEPSHVFANGRYLPGIKHAGKLTLAENYPSFRRPERRRRRPRLR